MDGIVSRPGDGEFLIGEDRELRVKLSRDELDVLESGENAVVYRDEESGLWFSQRA